MAGSFYFLLSANKNPDVKPNWQAHYYCGSLTDAVMLSTRYAREHPFREVEYIMHWDCVSGALHCEDETEYQPLPSKVLATPGVIYAIQSHVHYWLAKALHVALGMD